jgi:hypothetical protein
MRVGYFLSCEEFGPYELLDQARRAQDAGFDALGPGRSDQRRHAVAGTGAPRRGIRRGLRRQYRAEHRVVHDPVA